MPELKRIPDADFASLIGKTRYCLALLLKRRSGEELSRDESTSLRTSIVEILTEFGTPLPFNGWIATKVIMRRPGPVLKRLGVLEEVNELLTFVIRLCDEVGTRGLDLKVKEAVLQQDQTRIEQFGAEIGLLCESLGRLWLSDVVRDRWETLEYVNDSIKKGEKNTLLVELDAVAHFDRGSMREYLVAEIKKSFRKDDIQKFTRNLSHFNYYLRKRSSKAERSEIYQPWIVSFNKIDGGLREEISVRFETDGLPNPKVVDITEIIEKCSEAKGNGTRLLASVVLLQKLNLL